jgi:hypothetical protein
MEETLCKCLKTRVCGLGGDTSGLLFKIQVREYNPQHKMNFFFHKEEECDNKTSATMNQRKFKLEHCMKGSRGTCSCGTIKRNFMHRNV